MKRRLLLALALIAPMITGGLVAPQPAHAGGATFYASPGGGSLTVGQTVSVGIYINSGGQPINAGEATVTWNGFQYLGVTGGGIFTTWASGGGAGPVGSGSSVYFSGGLANPGYNGGGGRVVTISLRATAAGTASVSVAGSQILANDGQGTNVLAGSSGAAFTVVPPKPPPPRLSISSSTHPNESQWYTSHNFSGSWSSGAGSTFSYGIDQSSGDSPGSQNNSTTSISQNLADGTWYLHVKATSATGTTTATFTIHIDSTPPSNFAVVVDNGGNTSNPTPTITFSAGDAASGIDHYSASLNGGPSFPITSGQPLAKQHPGSYTLVVTAFDKAGNGTSATAKFTITGIAPPKILSAPSFLVILQPMHYIGQSEPGDTITVFLNNQVIDSFVASSKQAPKSEDKGGGGFPNGITWDYTYHPQLFPATYHIHFSRVNSVGAESSPTPDYPLVIAATPKTPAAKAEWFGRGLLIALLAFIVFQFVLELGLGLTLQYRTWLLNNALHRKVVKPLTVRLVTGVNSWRPFGWLTHKLFPRRRSRDDE